MFYVSVSGVPIAPLAMRTVNTFESPGANGSGGGHASPHIGAPTLPVAGSMGSTEKRQLPD